MEIDNLLSTYTTYSNVGLYFPIIQSLIAFAVLNLEYKSNVFVFRIQFINSLQSSMFLRVNKENFRVSVGQKMIY